MEGLGGHTGIPDIPAISLFGKALDQGETIYYLIWAFLLLAVWSTRNLLDSREGRAIRAQGWPRHGRIDGRGHGPLAHGDLHHRRAAGLRLGLAVRAHAALRQSESVRPADGHRIPVHDRHRRRGPVWGALVGAGVFTVLKQWLQDLLPKVLGQTGNFEVIVFGFGMVLLLHRARSGLWPLLTRWVPVRVERKLDLDAAPLPRKPMPPRGGWCSRRWT